MADATAHEAQEILAHHAAFFRGQRRNRAATECMRVARLIANLTGVPPIDDIPESQREDAP